MKSLCSRIVALSLFISSVGAVPAATITVAFDKPGSPINPSMWGVFFEDINFGADGGLYAELIKNRSFEFPEALLGWTVPGDRAGSTQLAVQKSDASGPNIHFLKLESTDDRRSSRTKVSVASE